MSSDQESVLHLYVPTQALAYCGTLQKIYGFDFRVSRPRRSKWGDYRYRKSVRGVRHTITVNGNLNQYAFLITYLHEVAHLRAFQQHGHAIPPHGAAWKRCFTQLLVPVLSEAVFPLGVLGALRPYARNPCASSGADARLTEALQQYDSPTDKVLLRYLPVGTRFEFRERTYVKRKVRRTRARCEEVSSGKQYLILETTLVDLPD